MSTPTGPGPTRPPRGRLLSGTGILLVIGGVIVTLWIVAPFLDRLATWMADSVHTALGWEITPLVGKVLLAVALLGVGAVLFLAGLLRSWWDRRRTPASAVPPTIDPAPPRTR